MNLVTLYNDIIIFLDLNKELNQTNFVNELKKIK